MIKKSFTLIELIIVIVLLGIVSSIGVGLLKIVFDGYFEAKNLFQLFYEAKFGAERIARELREAVPNSIVVDNSSITFTKFSKGGYYYKLFLPDKIGVTDNITLNVGDLISIYNTSYEQIYNSNICNPNDNSSSIYRIDNTTNGYTLCKNVVQDSPISKFYLLEEVVTFRFINGQVLRCSSNNFTQYPANDSCLVLLNYVKSGKFMYNIDYYTINDQVVDIYLEMSKNNTDLNYKHKVHIRNTP